MYNDNICNLANVLKTYKTEPFRLTIYSQTDMNVFIYTTKHKSFRTLKSKINNS